MNLPEALKQMGPAFLDAWYVVDENDRIVDFNPAFHAMFQRSMARNLKKLTCREAAVLPPCQGKGDCLRQSCHASGPVRLDELEAVVGNEKMRLIISAAPVELEGGGKGALIVLRNVTDEGRVQERYQSLMREAEAARKDLEQRFHARTQDLLAANTELNRLEREIARLKRRG